MSGVSRQADQYPLRMPPGMRERIRQSAETNRRSMNSEIVHHLDRALAAENENGPASVGALPGQEHETNPR
ncbi:MAG: Arc family DNA-binding protein [Devosia sp.]|nr:Arc family DNA-binding protein [Devosia sp.]